MTTLSVVMPAYNEEGAIAQAVAEVQALVLDTVPDSELVIVDDGSRDRTGAILDALAQQDPRIRVVHRSNGGHGPALHTGLDAAIGTLLFLVDSDRQIPMESWSSLWAAMPTHDAAFGVRLHRQDPLLRRILTRALRLSIRLLFGIDLRDANAPFKLLRGETWRDARSVIPLDALTPSLLVAIYVRRRGLRLAEIAVPHRARRTGVTSIRRLKLLSFCARAFPQLVAFRRAVRG